MKATFRQSMAWLHTWSGVFISALLFVIFWMGTLSVFDQEIDRWMKPMTRLQPIAQLPSLDNTWRPTAERIAPKSSQWTFVMPTERLPTTRFVWRNNDGKNIVHHLEPATGKMLPEAGSHAGTGFIYPFHFRLHISFMDIGLWIVGFAAMAMLVAIVSGVVIHKKIFREFFTFRPKKQTQRATLDLHNLSGVLALPFHFVIALSGLIIMFAIYFPTGWMAAYDGDKKTFNAEAAAIFERAKVKGSAPLGSLDALIVKAEARWGAGEVALVRVHHVGNANSYVEVRRSAASTVTRDPQLLYFDAASGDFLAQTDPKAMRTVQRFFTGLHMIQFEHWTLRWLYFFAGLAGCVLIATGLLFWLESRRAQHAKQGLHGVRVVEAISIAAVPGIIIATLAFFIINRLLPLGVNFAGGAREDLEMWVFFAVWVLTLLHATWRGRRAWATQTYAIAGLTLIAVLLNWLTTGDHLIRAISNGFYGVAGVDLMLLLTSYVAWVSARRLQQSKIIGAKNVPRLAIEGSLR